MDYKMKILLRFNFSEKKKENYEGVNDLLDKW